MVDLTMFLEDGKVLTTGVFSRLTRVPRVQGVLKSSERTAFAYSTFLSYLNPLLNDIRFLFNTVLGPTACRPFFMKNVGHIYRNLCELSNAR